MKPLSLPWQAENRNAQPPGPPPSWGGGRGTEEHRPGDVDLILMKLSYGTPWSLSLLSLLSLRDRLSEVLTSSE